MTQAALNEDRILPLQGGRNFRDLGGYQTTSGRKVKWGVLYRSGVMSGLTDQDHAYIKQLGIVQICDFRAIDERRSEPTNWQAMGVHHYASVDYDDIGTGDLRALFLKPDLNADHVRQAMMQLYVVMLDRFVPHYTDMFARLVQNKAPLAFNCSAGKDRTGIAAALILSALGVSRETILADYALSDKIVDFESVYSNAVATAKREPDKSKSHDFITHLPPEIRSPLLKSDPTYLEAALHEIDKRFGSIEDYMEEQLGVSAAHRTILHDHYLD
jgi:protein-tyrosine phosphatase